MTIRGGCLCGALRYRYEGELSEVVVCHCADCKRAQGSAFALNAPLLAERFVLEQGQAQLRHYRHSPGKARVFCAVCGSPLYSRRDDLPAVLRLRLGSLDAEHLPPPHYQIYADSAEPWCALSASAPAYAGAKTADDSQAN